MKYQSNLVGGVPKILAAIVCVLGMVMPGQTVAKPVISYLLPDIGTTRYATYIEIIGPHNANNNFGSDGLSLNNPGDNVRVRCARPADTAIVKIGPCVVSWNGRMISTTVFVVPTVIPNSHDWTQLQPQFKIPLVVEVGGQTSDADTFYIVRPTPIGDKRTSSDIVFGEGSLGRRSRRGAMIIDSMYLSGAEYKISTNDTDPGTPGNQGYLPFVLMSVGRLIAQNGCIINASGYGSNGGPGGGGGGGSVFNAPIASSGGSNGGNGYTGGGPGGENATIGSNSRRKPGIGSGQDLPPGGQFGSASLNGNPGGDLTSAYENSGGGTGHPFGESGRGCDNKDQCNPTGGAGGGSGGREGQPGASAGNATDGLSSPGLNNKGRKVGNTMLVPLAGGSGGASGNPSGVAGKGSAGGGGGGAISIHASQLGNFDVFANGSVASLLDIPGGGGSGGGVILGSRLDNVGVGSSAAQAVGQDRSPYLRGAPGRIRYDFWLKTSATTEIGILSDTITVSLRDVSIIGNASGQDVCVFIKPENGSWTEYDTISNYAPTGSSGSWRFSTRLPGTDTVYYIAFGLIIPSPVQGQFTAEPSMVFSQSAWNIIRLKGPPIIKTDKKRDLGVYRCEGEVVRDTIVVTNLGESPLEITTARFIGNPTGYSVVSPTAFPDSIQSNDSKVYVIEFRPPATMSGLQSEKLELVNTDTSSLRNPWIVEYVSDVRPIKLSYRYRGSKVDTVNVGPLCVNSVLSEQIILENIGLDPVTPLSFVSSNRSLVEVSANLPFTIDVGGFRNLNFTIVAKRVGPGVVATLLNIDGCDEPDTVWIRFEGVAPGFTLLGTGQFGIVPTGSAKQLLLQLRNDGSSDLDVGAIPAVPAPFRLVSATPALPGIIKPGGVVDLLFEYAPIAGGSHQATVKLMSSNTTTLGGRSCSDSVIILLAGQSQAAQVIADPGFVVYPPTRTCQSAVEQVLIRNTGGIDVNLLYPAFINGTNQADFTILRQPKDTILPPGGTALYEIAFRPVADPTIPRSAILSVRTTAFNATQIDVPLSGTLAYLDLAGNKYIDAGLVAVGNTVTIPVQYTNTTGSSVTIDQIVSSRSTVVSATPAPFTLANGDMQVVTITVSPLFEMSAVDTLWFISGQPCADSFPVLVRWTAENASVGITNTIDFGALAECMVKTDTILITNTSNVPADLISAGITGPDAPLFTILNPAAVTGTTMQPGEIVKVVVQFDPRGGTDGAKFADVTIRVRLNNQPTPFVCTLSGVRATSIPNTPGPVVFGFVDVQQSSTQTVTFINTGALPVTIKAISLKGESGGVITISGPAMPYLLQPGERLDLAVTFSPTDNIAYVDTIYIDIDQPCADRKAVAVSGRGRLNVEIEVRMPTLTVSPAEDKLVIPVGAQIVAGAASSVTAEGRMVLRYSTSVMVVQRVSIGTILRNESIGGVTELEILLPQVTVTDQESVITELLGQATLGSTDSTELHVLFAELSATSSTYTTRKKDGWLRLDICREGGPRLIKKAGQFKVNPYPSPAADNLLVDVEVYEKGLHILELVNPQGVVVDRITFVHTIGDAARVVQFNVQQRASGMYALRLTTPSRVRIVPAVVMH